MFLISKSSSKAYLIVTPYFGLQCDDTNLLDLKTNKIYCQCYKIQRNLTSISNLIYLFWFKVESNFLVKWKTCTINLLFLAAFLNLMINYPMESYPFRKLFFSFLVLYCHYLPNNSILKHIFTHLFLTTPWDSFYPMLQLRKQRLRVGK